MYVMKLFEKKTGVTKTLARKIGGGYQSSVATKTPVEFTDTAEAKAFMKENMEPYAPAHYDLYLSKIRKSGRGSYGKKRLTGKRLSKSQRAKLRYSLAPGSFHGRTNPDVFRTHQKRIALDTLKMSPAMAGIMGGMSLKEAYLFLLQKEGWSDKKIQDYMREHGHSHTEIQELMKAIHIPRSNPDVLGYEDEAKKMRSKGYRYTVTLKDKGLLTSETFYFKTLGEIGPFIRTEYPNAKMLFSGTIESFLASLKKSNPRKRRNPDDEESEDFDLRYEMEEGYVITDRTRGGYDVSLSGKYLGNFGDFDDALAAAIKDMQKSNFYPNVFFVNDHGNVDLLSVSIKRGKVTYKTIQSWV